MPVLGVIPFIRPEEVEETLVSREGMGEGGALPERYTRLFTHFAPSLPLQKVSGHYAPGLNSYAWKKG